MKKLLLFITLITTWISTSQVYPVQVTPQLVPPYSLKLSDYETTAAEKLFVNLLLKDTQESGRQVRLKMYIEGQGLNIQTLDFVAGATPLFLDGGINQRLSNLDLTPYFNLNNLTGITPQQYNQALPDGSYRFCFEVYDYFSGQSISQKSCFQVYLILNDPPFLNLPYKGDLVMAKNPQNILFNWTPRHINATGVQYEFTLKELWDTGIDPQAAFLSSPPLHQEISFSPTLLYGPANIQLLEGKTYGWQVRALVSDGISETSVFRNNGFSEIYHFKYTGNCDTPAFIISEAHNSQTVQITWQFSEHLRYEIQYRKKGYGDDDWFKLFAYNQQSTINNLEPGTIYEFRVGGECTPQGGFAFSQIYEFTTPTENEVAYYNCGIPPDSKTLVQDPLPNISQRETFIAGDFPVVIVEVSGSNGNFTGWGYITLPFLEKIKEITDALNEASYGDVNIGKYTRIRVKFNGIGINTNYQLISGIVETEYDPNWKGIVNTDQLYDDVTDFVFGDDGKIDSKVVGIVIESADNIKLQENGDVIITTSKGAITINPTLPAIITDASNPRRKFSIDKDGNVEDLGIEAPGGTPTHKNTNGIANNGTVKQISSKDVSVVFNPSGFYGTDVLPQGTTNKNYETIEQTHGGKYNVLYKAISNEPQETDVLTANATLSNGKTTDDIVFKTKQGAAVPFTWSGNTATLSLKNQFKFAKAEILATVKPADSTENYDIAGKVNVWHLQQTRVNVTVVAVNGASPTADLERQINTIYNKAGVHFTITNDAIEIPAIKWDNNNNLKFDIGDSNLTSYYSEEEKALFNYYKEKKGLKPKTYYIFLFGEKTSKEQTNGFMPLKGQYGFVFNQSLQVETIAHELGHGVFGLQHYEGIGNDHLLMNKSYNGTVQPQTAFSHMDWNLMHAPGLQLYQYTQGSDDGEYSHLTLDYVCVPTQYQTRDNTYVDLDGNNIVLGNGFVPYAFVGSGTPEAQGRLAIIRKLSSDKDILYYPLKGKNKKYYWTKDKLGKYTTMFSEFVDSNKSPMLVHVDLENNVYVNNVQTGEVHKGARNCPGLPKWNSSSDGSRCDSFQYITSTNEDDISLLNIYQSSLNQSLRNALQKIPKSSSLEHRRKGIYSHIQFANFPNSPLNVPQIEILEDKFHLLAYKNEGTQKTHFVVSFLKINNNRSIQNSQINDLAKKSIQDNENLIDGNKVVHVVVPYSDYESIFGVGLFNNDGCYNIGYAENEQNIITNNSTYQQKSKISESILDLFSSIIKPLYVRQFYVKAAGETVEVLVKRFETGHNSIYALNIFESKYVQQIRNLKSQVSSLLTSFAMKKSPTDAQISTFLDAYDSLKGQIKSKYEFAAVNEDITNPLIWTNPQLNNIGNFREVYILDEDAGHSYFASQTEYFGFYQNFTILTGFNLLDEDLHFYDFDRFSVIDPIVFGLADILSLIPIPYVDSVGDSIGLVYATARGDVTQASFFALGLALPIGTAYLKAGNKVIDKVYVITAKKLDNGIIEVTEKLIRDVNTTEIVVSSPLTDIASKAIEVKNALRNSDEAMQKIGKYYDDAAQLSNNIFAIFDNLPRGWTDKLVNSFKADFGQSNATFKALFNVADDAKKLNIAESWKKFKSKFPDRAICN